jgi:SAM-dependent methyltransferase
VVDRRLAAVALAVVGFAAGWWVRTVTAHDVATAPSTAAPPPPIAKPAPQTSTKEVFEDIYRNAKWGKNGDNVGTSGSGSTLKSTLLYRAFLEQFLKNNHITTVVDAGCGDWEFSQAIDWTGIDYKGYDIVESVIERDKQQFGKPTIQFFTANIVDTDLPAADLLISKHVLQHLPNADIEKFLKQIPKYRHVLLVDAVDPRTLTGTNPDINAGEFRFVDPLAAPFNMHGARVLTYWDGGTMHQVVHIAGHR